MDDIALSYATERPPPPRDRTLAALADRQHGVVSLDQLCDLGLSPAGVRARVAKGRLHRVHRGVYAVGRRALDGHGHWKAAVLACGPGAALSYRSAAALLGLRPSESAVVDVTVRHGARRGRPGIRLHGSRSLAPGETTKAERIECTTVARTLVDLADVLDARALERACERAEALRIFDLGSIEAALSRADGRRGAGTLRALLFDGALTETPTANDLEERFFALCRRAGVPQPRVNTRLGDYKPDFLWPRRRLIVETDGRATHGTRRAFEYDRDRDRRLLLAGYRTVRFTWRQVFQEPQIVVETLQALLA